MRKLILCILLAFSLFACSTEEEKVNKLSLSEDTYYLEIDSLDDLLANIDIGEGENLEIIGDYDLSKAGTYTVKFVLTDKDGNKTESEKTIIVDKKDKLDEIKKEAQDNKPSSPSISNEQPLASEKPTDGTIVETPVESKDPVITEDSGNTQTNTNTSSDSSTSNTYGLDTSNWMIQTAFDLEGVQMTCEAMASYYLTQIGYPTSLGERTFDPQFGDYIKYYDDNGNYLHTAIFLGNGMALHGNYTSNGETKVAPVELGGNYTQVWYYKAAEQGVYPIETPASSNGSSSNESIWAEYYENDADGYTSDMCAVPAIELSNNSSLAFWCEDYYPDLIIWE